MPPREIDFLSPCCQICYSHNDLSVPMVQIQCTTSLHCLKKNKRDVCLLGSTPSSSMSSCCLIFWRSRTTSPTGGSGTQWLGSRQEQVTGSSWQTLPLSDAPCTLDSSAHYRCAPHFLRAGSCYFCRSLVIPVVRAPSSFRAIHKCASQAAGPLSRPQMQSPSIWRAQCFDLGSTFLPLSSEASLA